MKPSKVIAMCGHRTGRRHQSRRMQLGHRYAQGKAFAVSYRRHIPTTSGPWCPSGLVPEQCTVLGQWPVGQRLRGRLLPESSRLPELDWLRARCCPTRANHACIRARANHASTSPGSRRPARVLLHQKRAAVQQFYQDINEQNYSAAWALVTMVPAFAAVVSQPVTVKIM
jgi:hypothetical protein